MSDNELKEVEFTISDSNEDPSSVEQPLVVTGTAADAGQNDGGHVGMPNKTTYTVLLVLGFLLGIIWGILAISPYTKMKKAIDEGDQATARDNAKSIKTYIIIGLIVNVVLSFVRCMASF